MRALVTGAAGVLGTWLVRSAPAGVAVVPVAHRRRIEHPAVIDLDLRDADAVHRAIHECRPAVIVHAAYAKDPASIVDATGNLAAASATAGAAMIHVSTEAVFSGDGRVRAERDELDPVSDYGRWKAEAEAVVAGHTPGAAIVRLPLIVSSDPPDHILSAIAGADRATWFTDEMRQPALASELATALWAIAERSPADRAGCWHLPGPESLSRLELARRIATNAGLDPRDLDAGPTPAGLRRPRDIQMSAARAEAAIGWQPSPVPPGNSGGR